MPAWLYTRPVNTPLFSWYRYQDRSTKDRTWVTGDQIQTQAADLFAFLFRHSGWVPRECVPRVCRKSRSAVAKAIARGFIKPAVFTFLDGSTLELIDPLSAQTLGQWSHRLRTDPGDHVNSIAAAVVAFRDRGSSRSRSKTRRGH